MGIKGCWTCRERKVRCDSQRPKCGNCTKARRICQGYGMQLSWPRDGDRKRAMISRDAGCTASKAKNFLNSSSWDMSLREGLENGSLSHFRTMKLSRPTYLSPMFMNNEQSQLLDFFNESRSLILGPTDEDALARFILSIAFSDPSDSNPVLQGVFALASQQLHGSSRSSHHKQLVQSAVAKSAGWLDEKGLLQNLMAMMLLYHHELSLESISKGDWVIYLCAVKKIINTSPAMQKLLRQEYSVVLDWIYYHEVFAEFTVRHWKVPYEGCGFAPRARLPKPLQRSELQDADNNIGCPINVLQLVTHACRQAIVAKPTEINDATAVITLQQNVSRVLENHSPVSIRLATRGAMVSDLHRIASLIYVNRAIHPVSGRGFYHKRLVKEGISLLAAMKTCQNAWPLFIIACEATDDNQRLAILDVFDQTRQDRRRRSNHIHVIQHIVEAVWNQHDLDEENQIDYLVKFDAVVQALPFIPPFA